MQNISDGKNYRVSTQFCHSLNLKSFENKCDTDGEWNDYVV
jgi:hypothetical protein